MTLVARKKYINHLSNHSRICKISDLCDWYVFIDKFPSFSIFCAKPDGGDLLQSHRRYISVLWCDCSYRSHGDILIFHRNSYALWTEQQQSEVSAKTGFVFSNCRKCVCSFWLLSLFVIEMYCNNIQVILYRLVSSGVSTDTYLVFKIEFENPCTFYVFFHFQERYTLKNLRNLGILKFREFLDYRNFKIYRIFGFYRIHKPAAPETNTRSPFWSLPISNSP